VLFKRKLKADNIIKIILIFGCV